MYAYNRLDILDPQALIFQGLVESLSLTGSDASSQSLSLETLISSESVFDPSKSERQETAEEEPKPELQSTDPSDAKLGPIPLKERKAAEDRVWKQIDEVVNKVVGDIRDSKNQVSDGYWYGNMQDVMESVRNLPLSEGEDAKREVRVYLYLSIFLSFYLSIPSFSIHCVYLYFIQHIQTPIIGRE